MNIQTSPETPNCNVPMSDNFPSDSVPASDGERWYYAQDGASIGPMSLAAIRVLWNAGELPADTLAIKEGTEKWEALSGMLEAVSKPATAPALPPALLASEPASSVTEPAAERPPAKPPVDMMGWLKKGLPENQASKPPPSTKDANLGCGCLVLLVIAVVVFLKGCFGGGTADNDPLEYKMAYLDSGGKIDRSSPEVSEYRRLLDGLATRFEISDKEIGDLTAVTVDLLKNEDGYETTMLEMMRGVHTMAMAGSGDILGKGARNYAYTLSLLSAQIRHLRSKR